MVVRKYQENNMAYWLLLKIINPLQVHFVKLSFLNQSNKIFLFVALGACFSLTDNGE